MQEEKILNPKIVNFFLDAWNFSCMKGVMPPSHKESIITLLPKEGKNIKNIKNWRPISLSYCDSKIITKALAWRFLLCIRKISCSMKLCMTMWI